jgi:exopolysaccharide production protein ExoZ
VLSIWHPGGEVQRSETFVSIQALRGVAALMVAFVHCYPIFHGVHHSDPPGFPSFIGGAFGVDLFFVISGFVMVYASEPLFGTPGASKTFFVRRLARIAPLYAAVTILTVFTFQSASPRRVLASITFWPFLPKGLPVLGVGWTLNIEMMFYAVFACALLAGGRSATVLICGVVLLLTILLPSSSWTSVFGNPIVIEFVYGMAIALAYRSSSLRLPTYAVAALLIAAAAGFVLLTPAIVLWSFKLPPDYHWIIPRHYSWGLIATAIIAAATLSSIERPTRASWLIASAVFLGDISYALYLLHDFSFLMLIRLASRVGVDPVAHVWLFAATMMGASVVVAAAAHFWLERPITRWLQAIIARRRDRVATSANVVLEQPMRGC